ncbi:MAG: sialate O-acetylesterase [Bacteroidales bacterium]
MVLYGFVKPFQFLKKWKGKNLVLELGPIDDMDVTYFNGEKVGTHELDGEWQAMRKYEIPAKFVKEGQNILTVRVIDTRGGGGIYGKDSDLKIYPANSPKDIVALQGEWKYLPVAIFYQNTFRIFDIPSQSFYSIPKLPVELGPNTPSGLFNGMINPLLPYTIRGAIWYQGESNVGNEELYSRAFPAMIEGWREKWGQGDFPFYYVQIAPWNYGPQSNAAGLRESQTKTLSIKNTGMAVTNDIGNPVNIHPANKAEVGRRLALWALAKDYGKNLKFSGPLYSSMEIKGEEIIVKFQYADGGLVAKKGGLKNFEIAGEDKKFFPATAIISGSELIVKNPLVKKPVAVRYLWNNDAEGTLFNGEGLPASNFRTDNW